MYKLKKIYDKKTIWHNVMGPVALYKEADQDLLKLWYKFIPECITYVVPKIKNEDDTNQEIEL
jgi:hypothetical protein